MGLGHAANSSGDYALAQRLFIESDALHPRAAARLSAANMALKQGDATAAIDGYLELLRSGTVPANHELLHRKLQEATRMLSARRQADGETGPPPDS